MNTKQILTDYEAEKLKREQAWQQRQAEEKLRRELNAKKVEEHFRDIVKPVLEGVAHDIKTSGYGCSVETVMKKDDGHRDGVERAYALCLRLSTTTDKGRMANLEWKLKYETDFGSLTVYLSTDTVRASTNREFGRDISQLTTEVVQEQVEKFLKQVFTV
jgi:hypothetical protein